MRLWNLLRTAVLALGLAALRLIPLSAIESVSLCVFYHLTGRRCPGCGMTRGMANLLHGNWERALTYNALSPVMLGAIILLFLDELLSLVHAACGRYRPSIIERITGAKKG